MPSRPNLGVLDLKHASDANDSKNSVTTAAQVHELAKMFCPTRYVDLFDFHWAMARVRPAVVGRLQLASRSALVAALDNLQRCAW